MQVFKKFIKANPREIFLQIFSNLNSRYLVIERLQIVWGSTNMTFGSTIPLFDTAGIYSHACPIRLKKKMWQYYCLIGGERREREKKVKLWQWNCQNWKRWEKKNFVFCNPIAEKEKKKFNFGNLEKKNFGLSKLKCWNWRGEKKVLYFGNGNGIAEIRGKYKHI